MQVAVAVNLALMLPEAFFAKAWKGAPLGSLLEGLLGLQMAVQFWGGLVVFLCVSGWRLFGLAASLLVLPFFVAAVAIIGFHI
jgi:hypothetical protein